MGLLRAYYQATDVKSAIICKHLKCRKLLILTDVNGIYTEDPKKSYTASKLQKINAKNLISMGRTSVDLGLAEKVIEFGIMVFVLGIDSILNSTVTMEELIFSEITMIIL